MPIRVQRKRTKGYRMPPNTVSVTRPGRYGNPFVIGATVHYGPEYSGRDVVVRDAAHACQLYKASLFTRFDAKTILHELRGKNLACYCPLDKPCHADVLLELANA